MATNPYATPESDVTHHSGEVENGSIFWGNGRLSVASFFGQYAVLTLIFYALAALLVGVLFAMGGSSPADLDSMTNMFASVPFLIGYGILIAITSWIGFCQMIKRFHDRNLSGWWVLTVLIVVGLIILFIPGKRETNRFGAWRQTRTWEKVMVGILILMIVGFIGLGFMGGVTGML